MDDVLEKVNGGRRRMGRAAEDAGSEDITYVGGVPNSNLPNFTGCIRNIFIKRLEKTVLKEFNFMVNIW